MNTNITPPSQLGGLFLELCIDIVLFCHDNISEEEDLDMAVLQVRLDDELKNQAIAVYNELGIDLSTAIRMFLKKSVLIGGIPFETKLDDSTLKAIIAVERMRDTSEQNGNSSMTLDEINEEIKKARDERKHKK